MVETVRTQISNKINTTPEEIFFIHNTSMGINFVANSIGLKQGENVIITDLEFPSNIYPWMNLKNKGIDTRFVKNKNGNFSAQQFMDIIDEKTKIISISWVAASNGTVQDLKQIGKICKEHGILLNIDGIQGLGALNFDVQETGCDFFVSGFFKWMLGPDGVAFVYIKKDLIESLNAPWMGWAGMKEKFNYSNFIYNPADSARRFETGNMNFSALYGLSESMALTAGYESIIQKKVFELTGYLRKSLDAIKDVTLLSTCEKLSGITLFSTENDKEIFNGLKEQGMAVSYGNGVGVSPHFYNTQDQINELLSCIEYLC